MIVIINDKRCNDINLNFNHFILERCNVAVVNNVIYKSRYAENESYFYLEISQKLPNGIYVLFNIRDFMNNIEDFTNIFEPILDSLVFSFAKTSEYNFCLYDYKRLEIIYKFERFMYTKQVIEKAVKDIRIKKINNILNA